MAIADHRKQMKSPNITGHITEDEQAERIGVTKSTLRRWRRRGYGPKHVRIGRVILYTEDADARFLAEQAAAAENQDQTRGRGRSRAG